tara:strand:+ start:66 stop:1031 length:966 start_codon:yes stop_codon:yes gene_type:complete
MVVLTDKDFPPEYWGVISDGEFDRREDITELYIPDRVWSIGMFAFSGCSGLTKLRLSITLTEIGHGAFEECSGLTELWLPDTLTEIGDHVFSDCSGLIKLRLPDTLTEIGFGAFSGCTGLTEIRLPDTLTNIGDFAFSGCTGLTELHLPDTLTKIGDHAFTGCSGLTELRLPGSIKSLGAGAFTRCISLRRVAMHSAIRFEYDKDDGTYVQFEICTSLNAIYAPPEVSLRFPEDMIEGCGTPVPTLLENATPDLGLWYYCTPKNYQLCSLVNKNAVLTILLVNNRFNSYSELEKKDVSRGLPIELCYEILSFVCRHQLGRK